MLPLEYRWGVCIKMAATAYAMFGPRACSDAYQEPLRTEFPPSLLHISAMTEDCRCKLERALLRMDEGEDQAAM